MDFLHSGPAQALWTKTAGANLTTKLWTDTLGYNAGHFLMVPLHAAFSLPVPAWQAEFAAHLQHLSDEGSRAVDFAQNSLIRLQYLYLASRFCVLAARHEQAAVIPAGLVDLLRSQLAYYWSQAPAAQWSRDPFPGGIRERLDWKLQTRQVAKSYFRAIIDEELFLFAIAADLQAYDRLLYAANQDAQTLAEILDRAYRVFTQEIVAQPDGRWLLQPGTWTDHPDYQYAGHTVKRPGLTPQPVPGIAIDISHSHRMPRWLLSLAHAYPAGSDQHTHYLRLLQGLDAQLFNVALVAPSAEFATYRTTNYLDGHNGIFRWGYKSLGEHNGYGPYELSGTLVLGWWAFLGTERSREMYQQVASMFPLPPPVLALYAGPGSGLSSHLTNGYAQLITNLASLPAVGQEV